MFDALTKTIEAIKAIDISEERKIQLEPFIAFVKDQIENNKAVHLNFICTHNSRRSHLAQIWAQTAANYFSIPNVFCYSGGTEATAMFPVVKSTLENQGFEISAVSDLPNPVYAIKSGPNALPIFAFSKKYNHPINPSSNFAAIMTCAHADENCPIVYGAAIRIPVRYLDPKAFDDSPLQVQKYLEKSEEIGSEMFYVFSKINAA